MYDILLFVGAEICCYLRQIEFIQDTYVFE